MIKGCALAIASAYGALFVAKATQKKKEIAKEENNKKKR